MIFTVVWQPSAERDLAVCWLNAAEKGSVAEAANAIDKSLRENPEAKGESRPAGTGVLAIHPLAVLYEVSDDDRFVKVLGVWRWGG